ncbi:MAG: hypothetical protein AAGD96_22195, partial [Chloroflexota bacterium]
MAVQFSDELMIMFPEELDDSRKTTKLQFSTDVKPTPKEDQGGGESVSTPDDDGPNDNWKNQPEIENGGEDQPATQELPPPTEEAPIPSEGPGPELPEPPEDEWASEIAKEEERQKNIKHEDNTPLASLETEGPPSPNPDDAPLSPSAALDVNSGFWGETEDVVKPRSLEESLAIIDISEPIPQAEIALSHKDDISSWRSITESLKATSDNNLASPILFQIEAFDEENQKIEGFKRPALMVIDMRQHDLDLDARGGNFFLTFENPEKAGEWIEVPVTIHEKTGLISAEVTHFSNWTSGWRPESWGMSWTPPTTAEFTGSASYSYPFNIPPGRGGLTPAVGLSYNSNSQNGVIPGWKENSPRPDSPVADGWSLQQSGVFRKSGNFYIDSGNNLRSRQFEAFTLVVGGVGYNLYPQTGDADFNLANTVRYFAKDHPEIRVHRYNFNSITNSSWKVEFPDGTIYTMGYTPAQTDKPIQKQCLFNMGGKLIYPYRAGWPDKDLDIWNKCVPIGWYVSEAVDNNGNKITWSYHETTTPVIIDSHGNNRAEQEDLRIKNIQYNFEPGTTNNAASEIEFLPAGVERIEEIKVYHGSAGSNTRHLSRIYDIQTDELLWESDGCWNHDYDPAVKLKHPVALLSKITEKVPNPQNTGAFIELPSTDFTYHQLPHFTKNSQGCFYFPYLEKYTHGYGGEVVYTYVSDGESHGVYER